MRIVFDPSLLPQTRWYELLIRFIIGGLITAATGIIGKKYGPAVGGLFLAFPAIFPASATLMDKHEKEKKQRVGLGGASRARAVVAIDAAGAAIGCSLELMRRVYGCHARRADDTLSTLLRVQLRQPDHVVDLGYYRYEDRACRDVKPPAAAE